MVMPTAMPGPGPLSSIEPRLRIYVAAFTDQRTGEAGRAAALYLNVTPSNVVAEDRIGEAVSQVLRQYLARNGHVIVAGASDTPDVLLEGVVRRYAAVAHMRSFRSQDELVGQVEVEVAVRRASDGATLRSKSYKGRYAEKRLLIGPARDHAKNALDRAFVDMLEEFGSDEHLLSQLRDFRRAPK